MDKFEKKQKICVKNKKYECIALVRTICYNVIDKRKHYFQKEC